MKRATHGRGRGNRGSSSSTSSRGNYRKAGKSKAKVKLEDHFFYIGSNKQASDYEKTNNFVINHIKRTFEYREDLAKALEEKEYANTDAWEPTLKASTNSDSSVKERENRQFEMKYKSELDQYLKRKRIYESNKYKAYALIWERCAQSMKNKIEGRSNYRTSIYDDPIELLKAIREFALNYQESKYEMSIIANAIRNTFLLKLQEGENLNEYVRRFKSAVEIMESHLGTPYYTYKRW